MHGLHLIKFPDSNNTPIEDIIKAKKNSKLLVQKSSLKDEIVPEIFKPQMNNTYIRTNAVRVETVQRLRAEKQRSAIQIQKSLSEMFGRPSYDIPTKKSSRKLQSLLSRKRKVLSNTTFNFGTAKEKWSKTSKQKNKIKRKNERRVKENNHNENIKVLFMSKNWKSKKLCSLLSHTKDIGKNANKSKSKSSCDLDLLRQKNTNFCCLLNIPQVKRYHKNTNPKRYLESCGHKYCRHFYSDHAIRPKNTTEKDYCHHNGHKLSETYNVVDFPYVTAEVPEKTNVCEGTLTHESNIQSPCKNKQPAITPSCCHYSKGGGDATASLVQSQSNLPQNSQHLKSIRISPKRKFKDRRKKSLRSSKIRPIFLVNALKYILFGLSIVIWSPCILIISILWIVTYPMKPQEIIDTVNDVESCKYDTCHHYDENICLSSIYSCVVAAIKKLLDLYEAMYSLLKKDQGNHTCPRVKSWSLLSRLKENHIVKEYPNPRKRYKLLYDKNRGWVIKPTKRRKGNYLDPIKDEDILKKHVAPEVSETNYENELQKLKRAIPKNEHNGLIQSPVLSGKDTPKMRDQGLQLRMKNNTYEGEEIVKYQKYGQTTNNIPNETQNHINITMNIPNPTSKNECPVRTKYTCEPPQRESHLYESDKFHERTQVRFMETNLCSKHLLQNVLSPFHPEYYSNQHERLSKLPYQNIMTSRWPNHRCQCKSIKQKQKCNHQKYAYPRNFYGFKRNIKRHLAAQPRCTKYDRAKIKQSKCKNTFIQYFRDFRKKTIGMIKDAESKVWNSDKCEDLYDQPLQKRAWSWVHRRWPTFYPYFLIFCKFYENLAYAMLYIFTACIWCPIFCWCYMCCNFFCRCVL